MRSSSNPPSPPSLSSNPPAAHTSSKRPEFVPLNAPRIDTGRTEPAEPVSWFERVAPTLPMTAPAPTERQTAPPRDGSAVPRFAGFRDVDDMAREERERLLKGAPASPEILKLRWEAEQAAQELVAQAQSHAHAIEASAREQGYAAGYAQGVAEGRGYAERAVWQQNEADRLAYRDDIQTFLAHIEAERSRAWNEMEPQIIQMVFELAKHVIKQEIEVSRDVSLAVVQNALRRVADGGSLRIRVHADDLQTVRSNREDLLTLVDNIRHVEIIEDRRVGPGGCIVETDAGNIDARLETQLAEAANLLDLP